METYWLLDNTAPCVSQTNERPDEASSHRYQVRIWARLNTSHTRLLSETQVLALTLMTGDQKSKQGGYFQEGFIWS